MTHRSFQRRHAPIFAAVLAGLTVGGCDWAPKGAVSDPLPATEYPQVAAFGDVADDLAVNQPVVRHGPIPPMSVSVPVRLLRDSDARVQYRFIFFDDRGQPIRPEMDWRFEQLMGRARTYLSGSALDPGAVDWRLEVRDAREP